MTLPRRSLLFLRSLATSPALQTSRTCMPASPTAFSPPAPVSPTCMGSSPASAPLRPAPAPSVVARDPNPRPALMRMGGRVVAGSVAEVYEGGGELTSSTVTVESDESRDDATRANLVFRTGVVGIPHPEKKDKGGEDAFFVQKCSMGVFDGVGGWATIGVDAGLYSRELARLTAEYVAVHGPADVVQGLKYATEKNRAIGSSTACVVGVDGERLKGVNLGDSGLIVIRAGQIVYRTTEQQHYFNCPFQIGTDSLDTVDVGKEIDVELKHGDWIILGTDGLWDNVFPKNVVEVVLAHTVEKANPQQQPAKASKMEESSSDGASAASDCSVTNEVEEAQTIAQDLAECAIKIATDERGTSPFAVNAQNAGHLYIGGKIDDITIVAALVIDPDFETKAEVKPQTEEENMEDQSRAVNSRDKE